MEIQSKLPANVYLVEYANGAIAIWRHLTWDAPHMIYTPDADWMCINGVCIGRYNLRNYEYILESRPQYQASLLNFRTAKAINRSDFEVILNCLCDVSYTTQAFRVSTTAELRAHENKSQ